MHSKHSRLRQHPRPASRSPRRPAGAGDAAAAAGRRHRHRRRSRAPRRRRQPTTRGPAALAREGFTAIFNGKDLTGWQALIDIGTLKYGAGLNPADLLKLSPAEQAAKQKESNDEGPQTLVRRRRHSHLRRRAGRQAEAARREGRAEPANREGIRRCRALRRLVHRGRRRQRRYLKLASQIQMWTNPVGSGGIFNNKAGGEESTGRRRQPPGTLVYFPDHPARQRHDDHLAQWSAGGFPNVKMENYWDYSKPLPASGNIELHTTATSCSWKNIYARDLK